MTDPIDAFSARDLARCWRVSLSLIRKELRSKRLKGSRVGRRVLILRTDALAYLRGEFAEAQAQGSTE